MCVSIAAEHTVGYGRTSSAVSSIVSFARSVGFLRQRSYLILSHQKSEYFFWLSRPHRESLLCPTSEQLPQLFVIAPRTVADSLCLQTAPHPLADAAAALAVQRSECARRWAASLIKSAVRRERLAAKADVVWASRSDGQTLCLGRRSFPNPAVCRSKLPR